MRDKLQGGIDKEGSWEIGPPITRVFDTGFDQVPTVCVQQDGDGGYNVWKGSEAGDKKDLFLSIDESSIVTDKQEGRGVHSGMDGWDWLKGLFESILEQEM